MTEDKKIEEMAIVLCADCAKNVAPCSITRTGIRCDEVMEQAEALYNAGYRKASDIAREIFEEIDRMCIDIFGNFNHRVFAELKKKYIGEDINVPTNTEGK